MKGHFFSKFLYLGRFPLKSQTILSGLDIRPRALTTVSLPNADKTALFLEKLKQAQVGAFSLLFSHYILAVCSTPSSSKKRGGPKIKQNQTMVEKTHQCMKVLVLLGWSKQH